MVSTERMVPKLFKVEGMEDTVSRLREFMENEARSGAMDFGCVTQIYAYRMFGGQYSYEDIAAGLMEIRKSGFLNLQAN